MSPDFLNLTGMKKGREYYIFRYLDGQEAEMFQLVGRFASDPRLSFTWFDASVVAQTVRNLKGTADGCKARGKW